MTPLQKPPAMWNKRLSLSPYSPTRQRDDVKKISLMFFSTTFSRVLCCVFATLMIASPYSLVSSTFKSTSAFAAPKNRRAKRSKKRRQKKSSSRQSRRSSSKHKSSSSLTQPEEHLLTKGLPIFSALDSSVFDHATSLLPWSGLLEGHPRYIQAARLESAKGRDEYGEGHPCTFQGELKEDTCIAFNWGSSGFLKNPIALPSTELYKTRESKNPKRGRNYGVPEMVLAIKAAVEAVHEVYPQTKRLVIGDLSRPNGGFFPPHLSHQSGRDADIGYYIKGGHEPKYLMKIRAHQLDVERTWTFLHSFLKDDKVQYVFMDYRLQKPLYKYLRNILKLSPRLLSKYISYPRKKGGIIRHLRGHADHMHVRFYAPQSLEAGKAYLRKHGTKVVKPMPVYYRIRRGDNLIKIAKRFRIKWTKLMKWNRLNRRKARRLRAGKRLVVGYRTPPLP